MGMRVTQIHIPTSLKYKTWEYRQQLLNSERLYSAEYHSAGSGRTDATITEAYETATAVKHQHYDAMVQLVDAAIELGMSPKEVIATLDEAGLSKREVKALLVWKSGGYVPGEFVPVKELSEK